MTDENDLPTHRVSSSVGIAYEALQGVSNIATLPYESEPARAAAVVIAVWQILVQPPAPEPAVHPPEIHGDIIGSSIVFGLAGPSLYACLRVFLDAAIERLRGSALACLRLELGSPAFLGPTVRLRTGDPARRS